jgi:hypothetical protein
MLPESDSAREHVGPIPRKSWSLPLSLQILGWFFFNVVVAGCVVAALFHAQSAPILNALITGDGGDRLEAIGSELGERLGQLPRTRWPELMASVSKRYHASFALVRRDGDPLAGSIPQPSAAVIAKVREFGGPRPPAPPSGFRAGGRPAFPKRPARIAGLRRSRTSGRL